MKYLAALTMAAAAVLPAWAQYDQQISVEGRYVPEYITHDRIGVYPRPVRFPLDKSSLEYSLQGVNADFRPQAVPIQATGWHTTQHVSDRRGYLEVGLGSWLESSLSAGYRIVDTRVSTLGVRLQHNSTSLWNPRLRDGLDTRQWRYDESLGIYGHHIFDNVGRIDAALDYHLGNFNYYGMNPGQHSGVSALEAGPKAPSQTLNDVAARVSWHSPALNDKISYFAEAGVRYFGYRSYYMPVTEGVIDRLSGGRETDVNVKGGATFPLSNKSIIGIDVNFDWLAYNTPEWKQPDQSLIAPSAPDDYGILTLTPYYRFNKWKINIEVGARIDLAFNAGLKGDRYDVFHIAPAVRLDYNAGPVKLFLYALGGSRLNTLASNYEHDYYQAPWIGDTSPVYSPIDANLGLTFGPFSGFYAGADLGFRMARGQYFGGFYQCYLNNMSLNGEGGLTNIIDNRPVIYDLSPGAKSNLTGISIGVKTGYDAGRYFKITAEGRYQPQNDDCGYFNGYDRPEWTSSIQSETNPWSTLKFKIGYELRALRMMPVAAYFTDGALPEEFTARYRLPNLSMLNFGASYGILENLAIWVQADNLLCRRQYYMPGLPEPRLRLAAGIDFTF